MKATVRAAFDEVTVTGVTTMSASPSGSVAPASRLICTGAASSLVAGAVIAAIGRGAVASATSVTVTAIARSTAASLPSEALTVRL